MNIFYLDTNPALCAEYHCDKHVVKMIIEYAQLLSTAHRIIDGEEVKVFEGRIYVDGRELSDSFGNGKMIYMQLQDPDTDEIWWKEYENIPATIIKPGQVWVIGDNRQDSLFGHFSISEIHGKIVLY